MDNFFGWIMSVIPMFLTFALNWVFIKIFLCRTPGISYWVEALIAIAIVDWIWGIWDRLKKKRE